MSKINVISLFFLFSRAFSQISGTILDSNTLNPLANVNVFQRLVELFQRLTEHLI